MVGLFFFCFFLYIPELVDVICRCCAGEGAVFTVSTSFFGLISTRKGQRMGSEHVLTESAQSFTDGLQPRRQIFPDDNTKQCSYVP